MQADLNRNTLKEDPFNQFDLWLQRAQAVAIPYPNAMSLATASSGGEVSSRIVLLRYFDENGFVFFSSYNTLTARQMDQNGQVSLLFPWLLLERQVKILGTAVKIPTADSLRFFATRHKNSQLGAWLSHSSEVVSSKSVLKAKWEEIKRKFGDGQVSMPNFWGGYRVTPHTIEFWQGRRDGLHDRFVYTRADDGLWNIQRLTP